MILFCKNLYKFWKNKHFRDVDEWCIEIIIIVIYLNIIIYTLIKLVIYLDFDVNTSADLELLTVSWVVVTILQGLNNGLQR